VGVEIIDEEHVVLDHGGDVVGAWWALAHVVVLHGHARQRVPSFSTRACTWCDLDGSRWNPCKLSAMIYP